MSNFLIISFRKNKYGGCDFITQTTFIYLKCCVLYSGREPTFRILKRAKITNTIRANIDRILKFPKKTIIFHISYSYPQSSSICQPIRSMEHLWGDSTLGSRSVSLCWESLSNPNSVIETRPRISSFASYWLGVSRSSREKKGLQEPRKIC